MMAWHDASRPPQRRHSTTQSCAPHHSHHQVRHSCQASRQTPLHAGPPIPPDTPLNIITPNNTYVRNDNTTNYAYPGNGTGATPPEQYLAYHPGNLADGSPIDPYETAILKNAQTGLYCQLRPLPSNTTQIGMICDQPTDAIATVMTYTGDGLSYNGIALVSAGPGQPLLLENTTRVPVLGPTADNLTLVPALTGPPIPPDTPLKILAPTGNPVRNDNLTNYAYVGNGNGTTPPELYLAYHAGDLGDRNPIQPGQTTKLQNEQTGMWCQLRSLPSNATQIGMICDQPTPDTATVMTYTGDGLAYNGVQLVAPGGPGTTLQLANTTLTPVVGPTADNLTFVPVVPTGRGQWVLMLL